MNKNKNFTSEYGKVFLDDTLSYTDNSTDSDAFVCEMPNIWALCAAQQPQTTAGPGNLTTIAPPTPTVNATNATDCQIGIKKVTVYTDGSDFITGMSVYIFDDAITDGPRDVENVSCHVDMRPDGTGVPMDASVETLMQHVNNKSGGSFTHFNYSADVDREDYRCSGGGSDLSGFYGFSGGCAADVDCVDEDWCIRSIGFRFTGKCSAGQEVTTLPPTTETLGTYAPSTSCTTGPLRFLNERNIIAIQRQLQIRHLRLQRLPRRLRPLQSRT